jgi:hypothetical protein
MKIDKMEVVGLTVIIGFTFLFGFACGMLFMEVI